MMMDRFGDKVFCNPTVKLQKGEVYPLIDIDKITPGYKTVRNVESIEYTGQGGAKFQDHDVLFARITPCLENGKVAIADMDGKNGIGSTELFVFRGIEGVTDTDYIYYLLRMKHIRQFAANSMTGASGRQRADLDFIKRIQWDFPKIEVQKHIAEILSAFDNLIEINNKRIKVLEQMAENLYKEWFVRFRFPGHETVKFENGFPTTWKRAKIADLATFQNGFAFKSEDYDEKGRYVVVTIKNVQDGYFDLDSIERIDFLPSRMPKYCMLKKGDVIMSLTGNVGRVCIVSADSCLLNQRVCRIESKYPLFAYMFFKQEAVFQLLCNIAYGTAQLNLSPILAGRMKTVLPPDDLMAQFNNKVSGLFSAIQQYREQNDNLIRQRDMLLPRLMSGKLEV